MGKAALQPFLTSNRSNTVNFTSIFQYRTLLNMAQSLCSAYITAARGTCTVPFIRKIMRYCSTLALLRDIACKMTVRWRRRNNYERCEVKARLQRARRTIYCPQCPWGQYTILGPNGWCKWTKRNFAANSFLYTMAGDQARKQKVLKHTSSRPQRPELSLHMLLISALFPLKNSDTIGWQNG